MRRPEGRRGGDLEKRRKCKWGGCQKSVVDGRERCVCKQNGGGKEINGSEDNGGDRRRRRFEGKVNMEMRKLQETRGRREIRGEKRKKMVRRQCKDAGFTTQQSARRVPKR